MMPLSFVETDGSNFLKRKKRFVLLKTRKIIATAVRLIFLIAQITSAGIDTIHHPCWLSGFIRPVLPPLLIRMIHLCDSEFTRYAIIRQEYFKLNSSELYVFDKNRHDIVMNRFEILFIYVTKKQHEPVNHLEHRF